MKRNDAVERSPLPGQSLTTELLIMADGKILLHNLTPTFAKLLRVLDQGESSSGTRTAHGSGDHLSNLRSRP
jgi:hypothetical protein